MCSTRITRGARCLKKGSLHLTTASLSRYLRERSAKELSSGRVRPRWEERRLRYRPLSQQLASIGGAPIYVSSNEGTPRALGFPAVHACRPGLARAQIWRGHPPSFRDTDDQVLNSTAESCPLFCKVDEAISGISTHSTVLLPHALSREWFGPSLSQHTNLACRMMLRPKCWRSDSLCPGTMSPG